MRQYPPLRFPGRSRRPLAILAAVWLAALIRGAAWSAPALPDTSVGRILLAAEAPPVLAVHVRPDSVAFGDLVQVAVDFAGTAPPDSALRVQAPWMAPAGAPARGGLLNRGPGRDPEQDPARWPVLPQGAGRLVRSFRVYGTDPFRLQAGAAISPVVDVGGRTDAAGQAAPVRDPRALGLALAAWVWILLGAAAAAALIWWLWRRRGRAAVEDLDLPVASIAWLAAVRDLRRLLDETGSAGWEGRRFLDRLAGIVRTYIGGRFLIGAREMTGREIVAACRSRGYPSAPAKALAALVDRADRRRYGPGDPGPQECREAAAAFLELLGQVRILPRMTPVPPADLQSAQAAWASLVGEFQEAGTGESALSRAGGGR